MCERPVVVLPILLPLILAVPSQVLAQEPEGPAAEPAPAAAVSEEPAPEAAPASEVTSEAAPASAPEKDELVRRSPIGLELGVGAGVGNLGPSASIQVSERTRLGLSIFPMIAPSFTLLQIAVRSTQDMAEHRSSQLYLVEGASISTLEGDALLAVYAGMGIKGRPFFDSALAAYCDVSLTYLQVLGEDPLILPLPSVGLSWAL